MENSNLLTAKDAWLALYNTKAAAFLDRILDISATKQILCLDREFRMLYELREVGLTKIDLVFVLNNIIERKYHDRAALYRLTETGLKLKQRLLALLEVLGEALGEQNISEIAKAFEKPFRESM